MRKIKVGMAAKLQRENLDSNAQQPNEGLNIRSFFPTLLMKRMFIPNSTYICNYTLIYVMVHVHVHTVLYTCRL